MAGHPARWRATLARMSHVVFSEQVFATIPLGVGSIVVFPARVIGISPGILPSNIQGVLTNRAHDVRITISNQSAFDMTEVYVYRTTFFKFGNNPFTQQTVQDVVNYGPLLAGYTNRIYLAGAHADAVNVAVSRGAVDGVVIATMVGTEEG